jgi:hypothetical protein
VSVTVCAAWTESAGRVLVMKNAAARRAAATIGNRSERFVLVLAVFIIAWMYFTNPRHSKANNSGHLFAD